jgi:hypothetical protein
MITSNKLINNLEGLVTSGLWPDMACGLPVAPQCMQLNTRHNQRIDQLISKKSTVSRELFSGQADLKRVLSSSSVSCGDWVCWPVADVCQSRSTMTNVINTHLSRYRVFIIMDFVAVFNLLYP